MGVKLVAFDDSEAARKGISQAVQLLGPEDEILIVMVVPTAPPAEFADLPGEVSASRARHIVDAVVAELRAQGVNASGLMREGDIAGEIVDLAEQRKVDLIVVGHRGLSKVGHFALGSVADKVARDATRPVLIVR